MILEIYLDAKIEKVYIISVVVSCQNCLTGIQMYKLHKSTAFDKKDLQN